MKLDASHLPLWFSGLLKNSVVCAAANAVKLDGVAEMTATNAAELRTGKRFPTDDVLERAAVAFGVPRADILRHARTASLRRYDAAIEGHAQPATA